MNHLEALREASASIQSAIDAAPLPSSAPTPCTDYDVAALVDHINWTHGLLLGALGGDVPDDADHSALSGAVLAAWAGRGTEGTISIGHTGVPAVFGLSLHVLEAHVHGWDLARALSHPFTPSPQLTDYAWEAARAIVTEDARSPDGPYRAAVEVPDDADEVARLIAFTGRNPRWRPTHGG